MDPLLTDSGRLIVDAHAFDIGMPASDAVIRITPKNDPNNVLEELVTNSSGQTPVVDLPAPPVEFSMNSTSNYKPYSEYDVYATMRGYDKVFVEGVQILPDTESYQGVDLTPRPNYADQLDIIRISEHTLWGDFPPKIPEDEVKPLPPATGLVVLPKPVIPEFMIVHAGKPDNAAAPNYWVPFKDYIKNVACSEIYATWPEQTIRANVLAIISFALNRVFTEWYRSQGHPFTITNSTAYDQAYVHGRNIFTQISRVVDNIFTTYITRPNIRQPLMTQYCDGQRVSCPGWMTQWGSKSLGDQGYSAINILKYYYGYEIYLTQAAKVSGVPASYPGYALRVGSSGPNVRVIQEQLNAISKNFPAIPKVRVDGVFGPATRASVQTFQNIFHLAPDGIVGFGTWYRLSFIYVAVTRMAELR